MSEFIKIYTPFFEEYNSISGKLSKEIKELLQLYRGSFDIAVEWITDNGEYSLKFFDHTDGKTYRIIPEYPVGWENFESYPNSFRLSYKARSLEGKTLKDIIKKWALLSLR